MNHQDFKYITWDRKSENGPKQIVPKKNETASKMNKIDKSDDIVPLSKVDPTLAKRCTEARIKKNLTRKQLAAQLSIAETYLNDYENCGKKPDSKIMNKIQNFVNKTLG